MKQLLSVALSIQLYAVSIPTAHVDNSRTGANTSEIRLTPASLQVAGSGRFKRLGSYHLDAGAYAQPLYAEGVTIASGNKVNLLIEATTNNTLYAFNADSIGSTVWSVNFGAPLPGASAPSGANLLYTSVGCVSTPVLDVANGFLYSVCSTNTPTWVLRKISLADGSISSSVTISGQVVGTGDVGHGDTTSGPNLLFFPAQELQRAALTLANGRVYIGFGSYSDARPWHGWVFAYNATTLAQVAVFCTSPNDYGAGVWGSGGGLSVDGSGNLYTPTGNGPWDGITAFGESILKFSSSLALTDWYTPSNWATLNGNDQDLSSGRAMLDPGSNLLITGAKDYRVYSLDRTSMGHLGGTAQVFFTNASGVVTDHSGIYGGTFINNLAFFPNTVGKIYEFSLTGSTFNTTPVTTSATFAYPGAVLASSSNGSINTVLWAVTVAADAQLSGKAGTLRAFDTSLNELYNSDANNADTLGTESKFASPTIVNGRVYVATLGGDLVVYGATNSSGLRGQITVRSYVVLH